MTISPSRGARPWGLFFLLASGATPLACLFNTSGLGGEASGGSGGSGGATSSTGTGSACKPGDTRDCYSGPPGTEGVGTCKAGSQVCNNDGMSYGPCGGEIQPLGLDKCD